MKKLTALSFFLFLIFLSFNVSSIKAISFEPGLSCSPNNSGESMSSRPIECEPCNQTNLLDTSCATTLTAKEDFSFRKGDGACLETSWGTTVAIDPSGVTIPFVGKKSNEDEIKYLADYFEGTNEYYKNYSNYWLEWVDRAGVLRKLSPMDYQNKLKKQMVQRALTSLASGNILAEEKIHDYKVKYTGRLCWDLPLLADIFTAMLKKYNISLPGLDIIGDRTNYCVFENFPLAGWGYDRLADVISFYNTIAPFNFLDISYQRLSGVEAKISEITKFPPDPSEKDYDKKWLAWKNLDNGKWFKLWQALPLVTREDTPGYIIPYLGYRPQDEPKEASPEVEKVPHLARLYELTKKTNQTLFPFMENPPTPPKPVEQIPTSPGITCGLADPIPVDACTDPAVTDTNPNDTLCCKPFSVAFSFFDTIDNPDFEACRAQGPSCETIPGCIPTEVNPTCEICTDPCDEIVQKTLERKIGIKLLHPYLGQIWNQTANAPTGGVFNIFRPAQIPTFPDLDAVSQTNFRASGAGIEPSDGQFYFNHLGGTQLGKDWLVRALTPWIKEK